MFLNISSRLVTKFSALCSSSSGRPRWSRPQRTWAASGTSSTPTHRQTRWSPAGRIWTRARALRSQISAQAQRSQISAQANGFKPWSNQVLPRFPGKFGKKIQQNNEQICIVILLFFKGLRQEIFYNKTKVTTQKIYFLSKLPLGKLKIVSKCFSAPFLPLLAQNGGRTANKIPRPKDIFFWPLLS